MNIERSRTVLRAAAAVVIAVGAVLALASHPRLAGPTALLADLVFWPLDGAPGIDAPATRLMCAIAGGVMVGWGVLLWLVASHLLPAEPGTARKLVLASIASWFVVDSIGSLAAGAVLNALGNVAFLLLFVVPVARATPRADARSLPAE